MRVVHRVAIRLQDGEPAGPEEGGNLGWLEALDPVARLLRLQSQAEADRQPGDPRLGRLRPDDPAPGATRWCSMRVCTAPVSWA